MIDPNVIVIPSRETFPGTDTLSPSEPVELFDAVPFTEALGARYETDAHVALYTLEGETSWPRLNKGILKELPPNTVKISVTALDWDCPGHADLPAGAFNSLLQNIREAGLPIPSYAYPTRRGARLFYVHDPLDPDDAESMHRGMVLKFLAHGIVLDPKVWEWNRIHRLPFVKRDGTPTPDVDLSVGPALDHATIGRVDRKAHVEVDSSVMETPIPDSWEALATIWDDAGDLTPFAKEVKKRVKGRMDWNLEEILTGEPKSLPKGERNSTLMKWIGCLASMVPGIQPIHVFGMLYRTVAASTSPSEPRDLFAETWKMACYCVAREQGKRKLAREEAQVQAQTLQEKVRQWPGLTEEVGDDWIKQHLAVCTGSSYYVLQPSGFYGTHPVSRNMLVAAFRAAGLVGEGKLLPSIDALSPNVIDARHCQIAHGVEMEAGVPGGYLDKRRGLLILPSFSLRTDLEPTKSEAIDGYLRALFGPYYPQGEAWLANALAFNHGPIAALSIRGPDSIGKTLLVHALADCITTGTFANKSDLGTWNYKIAETGFVYVDESWLGMRNFDGKFRELVTNDRHEANRKFKDPVWAKCLLRVILTANSDILLETLFAREDMSEDEVKAVQKRILHLRLDDGGAKWIRENGGKNRVKTWVNTVYSEGKCTFEFAKHLLWLHKTYMDQGKIQNGEDRFLVTGSTMFTLSASISRPSAAQMGYTLALMVAQGVLAAGQTFRVQVVKNWLDRQDPNRPLLKTVQAIYRQIRFFAKEVGAGDWKLRMSRIREVAQEFGVDLEEKPSATEH